MTTDNRGKKLEVYECKTCHGRGKVIVDWQAVADSYVPVGFSKKERRSPYGECGACKGRGFLLDSTL